MRLLIFTFIIVTMTGLLFPMHQLTEGQSTQVQSSVSEPLVCVKANDQPVDSVQMNSALIKMEDPDSPYDIKTIHVEKEIFSCFSPGGPVGAVTLYKDLTIYAEVFGSAVGPQFFPSKTTFTYTLSDRNVSGDIISCSASPITGKAPNLRSCAEETPIQSIEMNTLNATSTDTPPVQTVKTITSEKHIYKCIVGDFTIPTKVKETVIFTSLFEKGRSSAISFMGFTCIKDMRLVKVDYCGVTFKS